MKNGLLVWNVVLTLIAGYLLFAQLNKKGNAAVDAAKKNTGRNAADSTRNPFRIAYFEMDSVENNLDLVKAAKAEINKKEEEYNNSVARLDMIYRNKYNELQNVKSQAEMDALQNELKALGENLKGQKQDLDQKFQDFVTRTNLAVKKKIEDFLATYNKTKNYSYIIVYEQGLFYYKDTAYNITADVVRGLNESEKKK